MTVVDHPLRQTTEFNSRIQAEFSDLVCWRATLDMGIIVFLDFGERLNLLGKRGPVTIGATRVLIHSESWVIERGGKVALASDQALEDEDEEAIDRVFSGLRLQRFDWRAEGCQLLLSDDVVVKMDRHPEPSGRENLVEFRFSNGDFVDCMADGAIETERSEQ